MATQVTAFDALEARLGHAPTQAELIAELSRLSAPKVSADKTSNGLSIRRSEKGAVSIYGLGRFPVTLYLTQLLSLAEAFPEIMDWAEKNKATLASKPAKVEKAAEGETEKAA